MDLALHIGHNKTGSSYLQNVFRTGADALRAHGIRYPAGSDDGDGGLHIGSGNAKGATLTPDAFRTALKRQSPDARTLFWSSEFLLFETETDSLDFLEAEARRAGFDRIRVLLFIRDPLEHASSAWQQYVKRAGESFPVEEVFRRYDMPLLVDGLLRQLDRLPSAEVTIHNYSTRRRELVGLAEAWLGIPAGTLPRLPVERVNRSLTHAEIEFLRLLNGAGVPKGVIADALCERLPDIPPDDIRPPLDVQEATLARLAPAIERVNARLPEIDRYRPDLRTPLAAADVVSLRSDQLRVIAEALGAEFGRLDARVRTVQSAPHELLSARTLAGALAARIVARLPGRAARGSARARS